MAPLVKTKGYYSQREAHNDVGADIDGDNANRQSSR